MTLPKIHTKPFEHALCELNSCFRLLLQGEIKEYNPEWKLGRFRTLWSADELAKKRDMRAEIYVPIIRFLQFSMAVLRQSSKTPQDILCPSLAARPQPLYVVFAEMVQRPHGMVMPLKYYGTNKGIGYRQDLILMLGQNLPAKGM